MDIQWAVSDAFTLYGGLALQEAKLAEISARRWTPTVTRSTRRTAL